MTEEYKKDVLAYMLGKLENTEKDDNFVFNKTNSKQNDLKTKILTDLGISDLTTDVKQYITGCVAGHDDLTIIYGTYQNKGFFTLLNSDGTYITTLITTFAVRLLTPITNERYVAINGNNKFVYLSNFTQIGPSSWTFTQQKEYDIPSSNLPVNKITGLNRADEDAVYVFYGNNNGVKATVLKIGQGFEIDYLELTSQNSTSYTPTDASVTKNEDGYYVEVVGSGIGGYSRYYTTWDGQTPDPYSTKTMSGGIRQLNTLTKVDYVSAGSYVYIEKTTSTTKVWYLTGDEMHLALEVDGVADVEDYEIRRLNVRTNFVKINAQVNGNEVYYFGLINIHRLYFFSTFVEYQTNQNNKFLCSQTRQIFNLFDITVQNETDTFKYQSVVTFNLTNYNGKPYINKQYMFKPKDVVITNDDMIVFARDLFNYSTNRNIISMNAKIPNTMLNNITLKNKEVRNLTNISLVEDDTPLIKNIYENINLNFFNTYLIQNKNLQDQPINNLPASYTLTEGLTSDNNTYETNKLARVRINYSNGQMKLQRINNIDITGTHAMIDFSIYVDKDIESFELVDNGKYSVGTSYLTCDLKNPDVLEMLGITGLEIGKIYNFTQYVEII